MFDSEGFLGIKHFILDETLVFLTVKEVLPVQPFIIMNQERETQIKRADAYILAFSTRSRQTFEDVSSHLQEIRRLKDEYYDYPIVIVGIIHQLFEGRVVAVHEGEAAALGCGGNYLEVNCDSEASVNHAFHTLVRDTVIWKQGSGARHTVDSFGALRKNEHKSEKRFFQRFK